MNIRPTIQEAQQDHELLPTFVYGTLRPGYGNSAHWQGQADARFDGKCKVTGFRLVSNGYFPYAIPGLPDDESFGCLIDPFAGHYGIVQQSMDQLEGVPVHYERHITIVKVPTGFVNAYIYVATDPHQYDHLSPVRGNDWGRERAPRVFS